MCIHLRTFVKPCRLNNYWHKESWKTVDLWSFYIINMIHILSRRRPVAGIRLPRIFSAEPMDPSCLIHFTKRRIIYHSTWTRQLSMYFLVFVCSMCSFVYACIWKCRSPGLAFKYSLISVHLSHWVWFFYFSPGRSNMTSLTTQILLVILSPHPKAGITGRIDTFPEFS